MEERAKKGTEEERAKEETGSEGRKTRSRQQREKLGEQGQRQQRPLGALWKQRAGPFFSENRGRDTIGNCSGRRRGSPVWRGNITPFPRAAVPLRRTQQPQEGLRTSGELAWGEARGRDQRLA